MKQYRCGEPSHISPPPPACVTEIEAVEFLESLRWGEGVTCLRCLSIAVYKMTDRMNGGRNGRFLWRCRSCEKQFTVRHGTVFEDSAIELHKWCRGMWELTRSKGGVTPSQLVRVLGITPRSATSMLRRLSSALADGLASTPGAGGQGERAIDHGPCSGTRFKVSLPWPEIARRSVLYVPDSSPSHRTNQ